MPNIVFRFPWGRYHATPWGNHVNEGLVEWPPSPWRIVRALLATGYSKLGWIVAPPAARELVDALAGALPTYRLPRGVGSHTRHFMPTDSKNPEDRTKVFDAFAHLGAGAELTVRWPAALSESARTLLGELVPRLSYLGRAESVVEARLLDDGGSEDVAGPDEAAFEIASPDGVNRPGVEPITLLAPTTAAEYASWRVAAGAAPLEAVPADEPGPARKASKPSKSGKPAAGKATKARPDPYPADLFAALAADTAFLQEHGWTQPPGSRRVLYYRAPLATSPRRVPARAGRLPFADTALFALASDTRGREVLPRMLRALPQLELLHRGLLSKVGDAYCAELSGRDERGAPLEGHRHAALVPLDLDADGQLDHVLVHAPMGFGAEAQRALRALRATYTKGQDSALFVTLVGLGAREGFRSVGQAPVQELGEAIAWESRTPFVPPRHLKTARHTLEDQVQAELASRGFPRAARIEPFERDELVVRGFHHFVRERRHPSRPPPAPRFFGLRLLLERPARGPLSLGYASHFGLGLFVPSERQPEGLALV